MFCAPCPAKRGRAFYAAIVLATFYEIIKIDGLVKSPVGPLFVIPAKAGIQLIQIVLDSCFRRSDGFYDFLRDQQDCNLEKVGLSM